MHSSSLRMNAAKAEGVPNCTSKEKSKWLMKEKLSELIQR